MKRFFVPLASALLGGVFALLLHDRWSPSAPTLVQATGDRSSPTAVHYAGMPVGVAGEEAPDFVAAAEKSVNAVVHVTTQAMIEQRNPFADLFWGYRMPSVQQPVQGAGSGVIITDDGYIVTNN